MIRILLYDYPAHQDVSMLTYHADWGDKPWQLTVSNKADEHLSLLDALCVIVEAEGEEYAKSLVEHLLSAEDWEYVKRHYHGRVVLT